VWSCDQTPQPDAAFPGQGAYAGRGPPLLSTTSTLDSKAVVHYLGQVSGEAILGANIFKDFFAGMRDIVGGVRGPMSGSCARPSTSPCRR
jgi:hypothetical protein